MTPEDAVSELKEFLKDIERFPNDDTFRCELDREGVKAILAAIRSAENDALERAAIKIIGEWSNMPSVGMRQLQDIAEVVRALKDKEVT